MWPPSPFLESAALVRDDRNRDDLRLGVGNDWCGRYRDLACAGTVDSPLGDDVAAQLRGSELSIHLSE